MSNHYMFRYATRLLLAAGVVGVAMIAAEINDSEQVSKLLSDAKTQSYQLKEDASTLDTYTRTNAGWESHSIALMEMKEHINAAGRTLTKLDEARPSASPWQATAIDRIKPLLKEIAANLENTIQYVNRNPRRLTDEQYKDFIEANSDMASNLAGLIRDFVDYGSTKNRMERLNAKLELPAK